ncbi:MAG TPA: hypothetical protein VHE12_05410 [bacterium]|nr:hypothetical protein [bacterium]
MGNGLARGDGNDGLFAGLREAGDKVITPGKVDVLLARFYSAAPFVGSRLLFATGSFHRLHGPGALGPARADHPDQP